MPSALFVCFEKWKGWGHTTFLKGLESFKICLHRLSVYELFLQRGSLGSAEHK